MGHVNKLAENMPLPRLVLYPVTSIASEITPDVIAHKLHQLGLTHQHQAPDNHYLGGSNFLELVTFLGCSPQINLGPEDGEKYCYISLGTVTNEPVHLGHTTSVKPKCPKCKSVIQGWKEVEQWQSGNSLVTCQKCMTTTPIKALKWRQEAGFGIFSIIIHNIHAHEAVPAEQLLLELEKTTGCEWRYFYANNSE